MKILSRAALAKSKAYILGHCSNLTNERYRHFFEAENYRGVIAALSAFQNPDGGFGHGLEGDFLLPDSSPMATSVAFQILTGELQAPLHEPLVQKGILYLVNTYKPERKGWITVPKEVNGYPHASWWHYLEEERGNVIDRTWGNPTAELVGYLLQYRDLVPEKWLVPLYQTTLNHLKNHADTMEMHELYCFLRLAERMPLEDFQSVREKLIRLVMNAVTTDPEGWKQYSAKPLDFVKSPDSFLYNPLQEHVGKNLDYLVDLLESEGICLPPWSWEGYEEAWQEARQEITGKITLANLIVLKRFGRLEE